MGRHPGLWFLMVLLTIIFHVTQRLVSSHVKWSLLFLPSMSVNVLHSCPPLLGPDAHCSLLHGVVTNGSQRAWYLLQPSHHVAVTCHLFPKNTVLAQAACLLVPLELQKIKMCFVEEYAFLQKLPQLILLGNGGLTRTFLNSAKFEIIFCRSKAFVRTLIYC